jgi:hypothetical protein
VIKKHLEYLDVNVVILLDEVQDGAQFGDVPLLDIRVGEAIGDVAAVDRGAEGERLPVLALQLVVAAVVRRPVGVAVRKLVVLLNSK